MSNIYAPNINLHNVSAEEKGLHKAFNSIIYFGKLFDPGNFLKSETPEFHREIDAELLSGSTKPLAMIIARGHAKSTLTKAYVLHQLAFSLAAYEWGFIERPNYQFIGWVADSQRKSQNNVGYVKHHIEANEKLKYYFGDLRGNETWTKEDLVLANHSRVLSRSNLTSIRGETHTTPNGALRYSKVICDDSENEENTKTKNARQNVANTVMNGIYPAIDNHTGRLIWIGTPIHHEAFTQKLLNKYNDNKHDPEKLRQLTWKYIVYSAVQPDMPGGVLWDSFVPKEVLEQKKRIYIESPKGLAGFYQEFLLQVQSSKDAYWSDNHIRYWSGNLYVDEDDGIIFQYIVKDGEKIPVNVFIGIDPATSIESFDSDHSVLTVIAVTHSNDVYVVESNGYRSIPSMAPRNADGTVMDNAKLGVVDHLFDLIDKYKPTGIMCEDVAMNASVFNDFYSECKRRNIWDYSLGRYKTKGKAKKDRIYSVMNNRFASRSVYITEGMDMLKYQIVNFGSRLGHDDFIDSLHIACSGAYPPTNNALKGVVNRVKRKITKTARGWRT